MIALDGLGSDERGGATSVEMALLWTAMIAMVLAVVQVALVFFAGQLALTAAEDGLRAGRYYRVASADEARRNAEDFLARTAGRTLDAPRVEAVLSADGALLRVTVTGTVLSVLPGLELTVVKEAAGAVERAAP